jgi:hypothetical protein
MKKGVMIKILQLATVIQFFVFCISGVIVFIVSPERLDDYGKLVGIIFPIFITEVVPALIGTPLTEAVRNMTGAKGGGNECAD